MSFLYSESGDRLRIRRADTILAQRHKRRHGDSLLPLRARSYLPKHERKLPKHGRRLLLRSRRHRRLILLRQFEVGRVYTFPEFYKWEEVPDFNITLWAGDNAPQEARV